MKSIYKQNLQKSVTRSNHRNRLIISHKQLRTKSETVLETGTFAVLSNTIRLEAEVIDKTNALKHYINTYCHSKMLLCLCLTFALAHMCLIDTNGHSMCTVALTQTKDKFGISLPSKEK